MKTISKITIFAFILLGLVSFQPVFAQSEELQAALEGVTDSVEAIETEISPEEEIRTKQEALVSVFDLSLVEIEELTHKTKLGLVLKSNDEDLEQLAGLLKEALLTYEEKIEDIKKTVLSEEITLEEIRKIASDFKDWRGNIYNPEVKAAVNLILVNKGIAILETANARLEKISNDVEKLEAANIVKAGVLTIHFENAEDFIKEATKYKIQAKTKLLGVINDLFYKEVTLADGFDGELINLNEDSDLVFVTNNGDVYELIYPKDFEEPEEPEEPEERLMYQLTGILHDKTFEIKSAEWVELEEGTEEAVKVLSEEIEEDIRALIKKEAQSVMDAYREFLEMRKLVRAALSK